MEPKYNGKADVYSFAITCSEVLTGKPPFGKDVKRGSISKLVREGRRPILPAGINTKLSSLIRECWETDPQKRPTFESNCAKLQEIKVWETEAQKWPTFHWRNCFTICQSIKLLYYNYLEFQLVEKYPCKHVPIL